MVQRSFVRREGCVGGKVRRREEREVIRLVKNEGCVGGEVRGKREETMNKYYQKEGDLRRSR